MDANRNKVLRVRLSAGEYNKLIRLAGKYKCVSEYVRARIFGHGVELVDPKEFIRAMDDICLEMKRIGININQLAKYVNLHKGINNDVVIKDIETRLSEYIKMEEKLNETWRKLMRIK